MAADTEAAPQARAGGNLAMREVFFPEGLVGCPGWREFALVDDPEGGTVSWLQSSDNDDVGFFVTEPLSIVRSYRVLLDDVDRMNLKAGESDALAVYCILRVTRDTQEVTANLLGPLVVNWATGRGAQVVQAESGYSARHPVSGPALETPA